MTPSLHRQRGVATFTALALIGLVAAAALAVGALFLHQAQRSQAERGQAQVAQLLVAGERSARALLAQTAVSGRHEIPLPGELAGHIPGGNAQLAVDIAGWEADHGRARVTATVGRYEGVQTLIYRRDGDSFHLADATLERGR